MLADGRIDALYTPRTPRSYTQGRARRLFPDFPVAEADYWRRTGIFPVMHVVVIRADVYERDRWIARSLMDAFEKARRIAFDGIAETAALRYMLPWLAADFEHAQRILGTDYWTYGVDGNEDALNTLVRYSHEQGLIPKAYSLSELFAPETLEKTLI
jgi:4,5-dihydroxyphthalate decarboxylase